MHRMRAGVQGGARRRGSRRELRTGDARAVISGDACAGRQGGARGQAWAPRLLHGSALVGLGARSADRDPDPAQVVRAMERLGERVDRARIKRALDAMIRRREQAHAAGAARGRGRPEALERLKFWLGMPNQYYERDGWPAAGAAAGSPAGGGAAADSGRLGATLVDAVSDAGWLAGGGGGARAGGERTGPGDERGPPGSAGKARGAARGGGAGRAGRGAGDAGADAAGDAAAWWADAGDSAGAGGNEVGRADWPPS